jgi:two-component system, OmpR family, response regulator ResD
VVVTEIPGLPRQGEAAVRVLVVDDDETVAEVVVRYLQRAGLLVDRAADGVTALAVAQRSRPDLVVLDLMLPGLTGLEVCERLRAGRPDLPVVMLTALGAEDDRIAGLQLGADDYLVKPFSPRELVLRVQSVLRRTGALPAADALPRRLTNGDLVVDVGARTAVRAGRELALTSREFDLLVHLMAHPDTVLSREQLMRQVWGWDFGDTSTVTVHVRRLREKVEQDPSQPRHLVTVWGVGYRWQGATATPPAGEPREAVR